MTEPEPGLVAGAPEVRAREGAAGFRFICPVHGTWVYPERRQAVAHSNEHASCSWPKPRRLVAKSRRRACPH